MDYTPEQLTGAILNALRAAHGLASAELDRDDPKHQLPASYRDTVEAWRTLHDELAGSLLLPVPLMTAGEYAARSAEQRETLRAEIRAHHEHISERMAALLLAEAAVAARHTFPTAASYIIDVATDDQATLHAIYDSDGQTLWHSETCGCGPLADHPEHLTARAIESLFVGAFSYQPDCADMIDDRHLDSPDYDPQHDPEADRYRVTLPDIG